MPSAFGGADFASSATGSAGPPLFSAAGPGPVAAPGLLIATGTPSRRRCCPDVTAGEVVVISGHQRLRDGVPVAVKGPGAGVGPGPAAEKPGDPALPVADDAKSPPPKADGTPARLTRS